MDKFANSGLTLPDVFRVPLEEIASYGPQMADDLEKPVRDAVSYKEKRITAVWGSWDSFFADVLTCLEAARLIKLSGLGRWELGSAFILGEKLSVMDGVWVTVRDPEEEFRGDERGRLTQMLTQARTRMSRMGLLDSETRTAAFGILLDAVGDGRKHDMAELVPPKRKPGHLEAFTGLWMCQHLDTWVSAEEVTDDYNRAYPPTGGRNPVKSGVIIQKLAKMGCPKEEFKGRVYYKYASDSPHYLYSGGIARYSAALARLDAGAAQEAEPEEKSPEEGEPRKTCTRCGRNLVIKDNFSTGQATNGNTYIRGVCKDCRRERHNLLRRRPPGAISSYVQMYAKDFPCICGDPACNRVWPGDISRKIDQISPENGDILPADQNAVTQQLKKMGYIRHLRDSRHSKITWGPTGKAEREG